MDELRMMLVVFSLFAWAALFFFGQSRHNFNHHKRKLSLFDLLFLFFISDPLKQA